MLFNFIKVLPVLSEELKETCGTERCCYNDPNSKGT